MVDFVETKKEIVHMMNISVLHEIRKRYERLLERPIVVEQMDEVINRMPKSEMKPGGVRHLINLYTMTALHEEFHSDAIEYMDLLEDAARELVRILNIIRPNFPPSAPPGSVEGLNFLNVLLCYAAIMGAVTGLPTTLSIVVGIGPGNDHASAHMTPEMLRENLRNMRTTDFAVTHLDTNARRT